MVQTTRLLSNLRPLHADAHDLQLNTVLYSGVCVGVNELSDQVCWICAACFIYRKGVEYWITESIKWFQFQAHNSAGCVYSALVTPLVNCLGKKVVYTFTGCLVIGSSIWFEFIYTADDQIWGLAVLLGAGSAGVLILSLAVIGK